MKLLKLKEPNEKTLKHKGQKVTQPKQKNKVQLNEHEFYHEVPQIIVTR